MLINDKKYNSLVDFLKECTFGDITLFLQNCANQNLMTLQLKNMFKRIPEVWRNANFSADDLIALYVAFLQPDTKVAQQSQELPIEFLRQLALKQLPLAQMESVRKFAVISKDSRGKRSSIPLTKLEQREDLFEILKQFDSSDIFFRSIFIEIQSYIQWHQSKLGISASHVDFNLNQRNVNYINKIKDIIGHASFANAVSENLAENILSDCHSVKSLSYLRNLIKLASSLEDKLDNDQYVSLLEVNPYLNILKCGAYHTLLENWATLCSDESLFSQFILASKVNKSASASVVVDERFQVKSFVEQQLLIKNIQLITQPQERWKTLCEFLRNFLPKENVVQLEIGLLKAEMLKIPEKNHLVKAILMLERLGTYKINLKTERDKVQSETGLTGRLRRLSISSNKEADPEEIFEAFIKPLVCQELKALMNDSEFMSSSANEAKLHKPISYALELFNMTSQDSMNDDWKNLVKIKSKIEAAIMRKSQSPSICVTPNALKVPAHPEKGLSIITASSFTAHRKSDSVKLELEDNFIAPGCWYTGH